SLGRRRSDRRSSGFGPWTSGSVRLSGRVPSEEATRSALSVGNTKMGSGAARTRSTACACRLIGGGATGAAGRADAGSSTTGSTGREGLVAGGGDTDREDVGLVL